MGCIHSLVSLKRWFDMYLYELCFLSRVWFLTGGKPDPEKVFQAGQVQQAINSVKSVLFSPQVMKVEPTAVSKIENTPITV